MQSLKSIADKKILIVVAHPDDETLWFFQSIQNLKENNDIQILCVTYTATSKRGTELQSVAERYGLKILFGDCEDTGMNSLLDEDDVQQAFIKVFSKFKFDLVITHPPHGGEKAHPHHIQMFLITKKFSVFHNCNFGFFSEQKILDRSQYQNHYLMKFKKKKYIFARLRRAIDLIKKDENKVSFFLTMLFDIWINFNWYKGYEVEVDIKGKQQALKNFPSQSEDLKSYNAFYKSNEFLFIKTQKPKKSSQISI
jgi:hypothetical protein